MAAKGKTKAKAKPKSTPALEASTEPKRTSKTKPFLYEELNIADKLDSIQGWAREGYTNDELAKLLGVSPRTISNWVKKYPEFREALKKGKHVANGEILNSAHLQATGHTVQEGQAFKCKRTYYDQWGNKCTEEYVEVAVVDKFITPNPTITMFMLQNRLPEDYKDVRKLIHDVKVGPDFVLEVGAADETDDTQTADD